jgi:hypothetical protein
MPDTLAAGGSGTNGTLTINTATGTPALNASVGGPNPRVPAFQLRVGAKELPAVLTLENGAGGRTVTIDGRSGSVSLGGNGGSSQLGMNDSDNDNVVILSSRGAQNTAELSLGSNRKAGHIQLTTGGNPGPTIDLGGTRNALLFQKAGSNTENIVEINGTGSIHVGGHGATGAISVRAGTGVDKIVELTGGGQIRAGGAGVNGSVSVRGADGAPLAELLAGPTEGAIGVGNATRPGRISLFGAKGEAIRIDAKTGDVLLHNADCAEEFDVAESVAPGTVMVLTDDGSLAMSGSAYDSRVAGIVSGAGTYKPALLLDRRDTGRLRLPIALMGKVFCLVDAEKTPVRVGDLLTTADRPGHAMRITDRERAPGAVIGKALAPLASGVGLVPVLVSLQ